MLRLEPNPSAFNLFFKGLKRLCVFRASHVLGLAHVFEPVSERYTFTLLLWIIRDRGYALLHLVHRVVVGERCDGLLDDDLALGVAGEAADGVAFLATVVARRAVDRARAHVHEPLDAAPLRRLGEAEVPSWLIL